MKDKTQDELTEELIAERAKVYGDPVVTFPLIAEVWSGILGVEVRADQVPLCLIGMKLVRTSQAPNYSDNSDDIAGYLNIFRTIVGDDMVQARTVDEYVAAKARRESVEPEPATHHLVVRSEGSYGCSGCGWELGNRIEMREAREIHSREHSVAEHL